MHPTQHSVVLIALLILGAPVALLVAFLWIGWPARTQGPIRAGVTFSIPYAMSLGLNWRETLIAALDDMHVRHFRIPVYWNVVEPVHGTFDWTTIDFQLDEISRRNGTVLLSAGLKNPRWPECWMPDWVKPLSVEQEHAARLEYLRATVERYRSHPALEAWQIENEPTFRFGICPPPDRAFFKKEVAVVRALDPDHPVYTTDSGELASWLAAGPSVDGLGVSVYRVVRVQWLGWVWPYTWIPPYWYARHALLVSPWVKNIYVSEFQMEPWIVTTVPETPLAQQFETFDPERMRQNFVFAERMQFRDIDFWGVEWWWWMKTQQQDPRFWDMAKTFFQTHAERDAKR